MAWVGKEDGVYGRAFQLGPITVLNEITSALGYKSSTLYCADPDEDGTFVHDAPKPNRTGALKEVLKYFELSEELTVLGELRRKDDQWQLHRHWLCGLLLIPDFETYLKQQCLFFAALCGIALLQLIFFLSRIGVHLIWGI